MSGTPIKTERRRLAREALLLAAREAAGISGVQAEAVELLMPMARKLWKMASKGKESATTLGAAREVMDRVDGKVAQEIISDPLGLEDLEAALERISERRRARMLEAQGVEKLIGSGDGS